MIVFAAIALLAKDLYTGRMRIVTCLGVPALLTVNDVYDAALENEHHAAHRERQGDDRGPR